MQSVHLQKMMQGHKVHPEYDLVLPNLLLKKKSLKKLSSGDVLLLGLETLELHLMKEGVICAKVALESVAKTVKVRVVALEEVALKSNDSKKYENIVCSFGKLQCRTLEIGHRVEIPSLDTDNLTLFWADKKRCKASFVTVDDEVAIEIHEVYQ